MSAGFFEMERKAKLFSDMRTLTFGITVKGEPVQMFGRMDIEDKENRYTIMVLGYPEKGYDGRNYIWYPEIDVTVRKEYMPPHEPGKADMWRPDLQASIFRELTRHNEHFEDPEPVNVPRLWDDEELTKFAKRASEVIWADDLFRAENFA